MSYYKDLLLEAEVMRGFNHLSIESSLDEIPISFDSAKFEKASLQISQESVSLEGLSIKQIWEMIKKLFTKIKDYFISFFKWFKEKVMSFFKSKTVERRVEKLKTLIDTETIDDKDFNEVLNEIRAKHSEKLKKIGGVTKNIRTFSKTKNEYLESSNNFPNIEIYSVITPEGKLFDIEKQYREVEKVKREVIEPALRGELSNIDNIRVDHFGARPVRAPLDDLTSVNYAEAIKIVLLNGWSMDTIGNEKSFPKMSLRYFYSMLENIDELIDDAEHYAKRCEAEIAPHIRKLEQEIKSLTRSGAENNENKEKLTNLRTLLNHFYFYIRVSILPLRSATTYIRLLGEIDSRISSEAYITETGLKFEHLYHLSVNNKLDKSGELIPVIPDSGRGQFLPKRTSFAETVEGCYYGTPSHWVRQALHVTDESTYKRNRFNPGGNFALDVGNGTLKRTMYLYEGLPDEKTRFIKPKLVESAVGEGHLSKEICTTTPVKIRKVGLIEVEFKPSKVTSIIDSKNNHHDYGRFIGYRVIDEK